MDRSPSLPFEAAAAPSDTAPAGARIEIVLAALLLPVLLTALLHVLALRPMADRGAGLLAVSQALQLPDGALLPPDAAAVARASPVALPFFAPAGTASARPQWFVANFELAAPADTSWTLAFTHRTSVLVYLDGRLLANSVPIAEADLPPRNLQIGDRRLAVNVPADWLGGGRHELAIRVGAAGPGGVTLGALTLGPAPAVQQADLPRRFWLALRVVTALSALVIGTLLLFVWLVDRGEWPYLWSGLQLLMLCVLLLPYVLSAPPLPAPWWRVVLDGADVIAKGLAPAVIASWAGGSLDWARRFAFGYLIVALPIDLLAAYHALPWADFSHPWPWWALASRAAILALAVAVALRAVAQRAGPWRLVTAVMAGLALWIWADVTVFALVLPGRVPVFDLNVVAYAGWALWVGVMLHRRLVRERQRERRTRDELADKLAQRTRELQAQFEALKASETARLAIVERERLLQEMHDGLGAQLTTAKMLASSGRISTTQMVDTLDACIRELRLTVDALSVTDGDLGLLLGTLRQRLEPGLRGAGIHLEWRVEDTPHVPVLAGTGGRELARIVQEALANVLHHAHASRVIVGSRVVAGGSAVQITIADDGDGMPEKLVPGRGLRNMRTRAARLDGTIQWRRPVALGRGAEMVLELPLKPR